MGEFLTPLKVQLIDDTAHDGQGEWMTLEELVYKATDGTRYVVPTGFVTNFPVLHPVIGCRAHKAVVLHNYLCKHSIIQKRDADDLFYEALLAVGTPSPMASLMHIVVRSSE